MVLPSELHDEKFLDVHSLLTYLSLFRHAELLKEGAPLCFPDKVGVFTIFQFSSINNSRTLHLPVLRLCSKKLKYLLFTQRVFRRLLSVLKKNSSIYLASFQAFAIGAGITGDNVIPQFMTSFDIDCRMSGLGDLIVRISVEEEKVFTSQITFCLRNFVSK